MLKIILRPTLLQIGRAGEDVTMLTAWPGGISWRWRGNWWCFRPPSNRPLFSERHGHVRHVFNWRGFRLFVRPKSD
jgi:hypothetical protein